jgi:hypothetical protein
MKVFPRSIIVHAPSPLMYKTMSSQNSQSQTHTHPQPSLCQTNRPPPPSKRKHRPNRRRAEKRRRRQRVHAPSLQPPREQRPHNSRTPLPPLRLLHRAHHLSRLPLPPRSILPSLLFLTNSTDKDYADSHSKTMTAVSDLHIDSYLCQKRQSVSEVQC